ncbi:MAG TPA: ABC transporter substrate-binding protein, partial [Vicinamibacterales bacterium]|nr:ABC transporter substrate-binding protein [Vicinamibacterales bacterium]
TQTVEPWLAESWKASDDGTRVSLTLRQGVTFSDGQPFTAADVVFSFEAVYDPKSGSTLADALEVGGKKLRVEAENPGTVTIVFPVPFAPGVRILDNLPILPRHKLEQALKAGTFSSAWSLSTPVSELSGLGPFVVSQYLPGQRLILVRNPRYWRKTGDGIPLPFLDRVTIEIIPDQNAALLRLDAGQIDMTNGEVAPESYATMKRAADAGRVHLLDLGVGYQADSFWFNLKPGAFGDDPRAAWLQSEDLRRAISMAVDRKAFADTVFFGAAEPVYGPETPSNKRWYWTGTPKTPYDPAAARSLLGKLGVPPSAHFSLVTQKGRPRYERAAAVLRDELKKIGLEVDVVALDGNALIERIISGKYDSVYFNVARSDTDPAITPEFWLSSGTGHIWNMAQKSPATEWERKIDQLMTAQMASSNDAERKRLFDEVQQTFVEHVPVLYFAAPRIYVALSSRVMGASPAVAVSPVLWAPDTLAVTH